ncbi:uncharacterized protein N7518_005082 [Penicillium psychrosexuale]|uniref:uncharacterized protein n=1 Tax=Penicillium psychrosexuale TaxID=1002107 RepID=UPI0025452127|nr:uncharacterized protein N7518_005082 [Penicillium psychrosexuale]KAJ5796542.1 hypothetical protein N7518_005082 [Penicillium psychrosexuale]
MNWPGDDGDWSKYDIIVRTLMSDLKAHSALDGLVWDIWDEPDIENFWVRSQQQWFDLYIRTYKIIREDAGFDRVHSLGLRLLIAPWLATPSGPIGWPRLQATILFQSSTHITWKEGRVIETMIFKTQAAP